jgi:hypothetical protein
LIEQAVQNAALIVAHPDDEILWFSSVLEHVGQVIFCYNDCPSRPEWGRGRREALLEHPVRGAISLDLVESEVFGKADWKRPEVCEYGLKLNGKDASTLVYEQNFQKLREGLVKVLAGRSQVITHNPWGEYGNEEHVQVYRAVSSLKGELGLNVWFSNYVSNKSLPLFTRYAGGLDSLYVNNATNQRLALSVKAVYEKNQCWTWYKNWEWRSEEALIREAQGGLENDLFGYCLPINMIKVKLPKEKNAKAGFFDRLLRAARKPATYRAG